MWVSFANTLYPTTACLLYRKGYQQLLQQWRVLPPHALHSQFVSIQSSLQQLVEVEEALEVIESLHSTTGRRQFSVRGCGSKQEGLVQRVLGLIESWELRSSGRNIEVCASVFGS